MIRYLNVTVQRNELHHQPVTVPAWELPLLESLYAGVAVTGETFLDRERPLPEAEYDRLERKYRDFRDDKGDYTGQSVVGEVYGKFAAGLRALEQAINEAVESKPSRKAKSSGSQQETGAAAQAL